jgi:hypothetical protein
MSLDTLFFFELVLVALLIIGTVAGAVYIGLQDRRIRRQTGRLVGTADIAVGLALDDLARGVIESPAPHQPPRREFYERIGLPRGEEMKMRLYSLNDCESELEGDGDALRCDGYVGALKAYWRVIAAPRVDMLEDEWLECSPRKVAGLMGLAPEEYGVDEEHKAILLRRIRTGSRLALETAYRSAGRQLGLVKTFPAGLPGNHLAAGARTTGTPPATSLPRCSILLSL